MWRSTVEAKCPILAKIPSIRRAAILAAIAILPAAGCAAAPLRPVWRPPAAEAGFVAVRDGRLFLDGRRYRFVGVNVYSLASFPPGSGKYYCGRPHSDREVEEIMREVAAMGGNVIRFDVYQSFAAGADLSRIDLIVALARRYGLRLIPTLENQWADCTAGGYKTADWYRRGYREPYGGYPLSFRDHVRLIVSRYRDEPVILMWQVMNEAGGSEWWRPDDGKPLTAFAADIAGLIKGLDRGHPLCLGTAGLGRAGLGPADFTDLADIVSLDAIEAHDYDREWDPLPAVLRQAQAIAVSAGKPFFVGEMGIPSPPFDRERRAELTRLKLEAAWDAGVDGYLLWSYRAGDGTGRDFDADDPLFGIVRGFTAAHPVR